MRRARQKLALAYKLSPTSKFQFFPAKRLFSLLSFDVLLHPCTSCADLCHHSTGHVAPTPSMSQPPQPLQIIPQDLFSLHESTAVFRAVTSCLALSITSTPPQSRAPSLKSFCAKLGFPPFVNLYVNHFYFCRSLFSWKRVVNSGVSLWNRSHFTSVPPPPLHTTLL